MADSARTISKIYNFIENNVELGEQVLVHSV